MFEVHLLKLVQHVVGVSTVMGRHLHSTNIILEKSDSEKKSDSDLLGKFIKSCIIHLLLSCSPLWPCLECLEAPVVGEGIVEQVEGVPSHVHLIHLQQENDRKPYPSLHLLPEYF